jgi:hypothetical protein
MSLYEIDHAATQARLDAITADGLRKLGDAARRSEEVDKQTEEMLARQEREKKALDEQVAQAKAAAEPEPPAPPRPATLALGGEEFAEARAAREQDRLPAPPQPAPPAQQTPHHGVPLPGRLAFPNPARPRPPAPPQTPPVHQPPVSPPRRTLALGAPEDREQPQPAEEKQAEKQAATRPRRPPAEPDDDMSGRTWLR